MVKPRSTRASWSIQSIAGIVAVVVVLYFAREIFIPLAFAVTLALILTPATAWLTRLHVRRGAAALLVVTASVLAAGAIGFVIFNQFVQVLIELPSYQENIHRKLEAVRAPSSGPLERATENVKEISKELAAPQTPVGAPANRPGRRTPPSDAAHPLPVQIVTEPSTELQYLREVSRPFLGPLGTLGIVLIFTVFLLIEHDDLRDRFFRLAGLNRMNLVTQALDDATRRVGRYLMLQFLVNAVFGLVCGAGLYFLKVPYAALWGGLVAILRIVPYVGSVTAGLLPLLLSLAVFDTWLQPALVFLMFATLELTTANFVEPYLYGTHTGISALALLLTSVFWTILWGAPGLILSTPLTVCLVVLGRHVPQFSFLHILLGDEPVLSPDAQLYQRLLGMDDHGARTVVEQQLSETSLLKLYDTVFIPALTMVERDRHQGALDADREEYIFMNIREMTSDCQSRTRTTPPESVDVLPDGIPLEPSLPHRGRFLCVPANDEADEIVAAMLSHVLEARGLASMVFHSDARLRQSIRAARPTEDDVIYISALPPFAFTHARSLSVILRRQYPKTKLVVGLWGFSGDTERAIRRFEAPVPDGFVTSLTAAVEFLTRQQPSGKEEQAVLAGAERG